jgi:hypothetical protein
MTKVVSLATDKGPKPKVINDTHAGQRYTVTFDPNAPVGQQWVWVVNYTRVYQFYGSGTTSDQAAARARVQIHKMELRKVAREEME